MKLGNFAIESLIVHDVPRHRVGDDSEQVLLSEAPSSLDNALRNFFTERIARSLSKNAFDVEKDPSSSSPLPDLVESILKASAATREAKLVSKSQLMATHL